MTSTTVPESCLTPWEGQVGSGCGGGGSGDMTNTEPVVEVLTNCTVHLLLYCFLSGLV